MSNCYRVQLKVTDPNGYLEFEKDIQITESSYWDLDEFVSDLEECDDD